MILPIKTSYNGTLGLRDVVVGKSYEVMNGQWEFKVLSKTPETVEIEFYPPDTDFERLSVNIADSEDVDKSPLWIVEVED